MPIVGWSVEITRKNKTKFLCAAGTGDFAPVWAKRNRKAALAHKIDLVAQGFKARVVPVVYTFPEVGTESLATAEEIERARDLYAVGSDNNVEVDSDARASRADDGVWVQAWVWLPNEGEPD